jgi:hypothetical protein
MMRNRIADGFVVYARQIADYCHDLDPAYVLDRIATVVDEYEKDHTGRYEATMQILGLMEIAGDGRRDVMSLAIEAMTRIWDY